MRRVHAQAMALATFVVVSVAVAACRDFGRFSAQAVAQGGDGGSGGSDGGATSSNGGRGGVGGEAGGAGGEPLGCGFVDAVADDFEDDVFDELQWHADTSGGALVYDEGGAQHFEFADAGDSVAYVHNEFKYDARDRSLTLELESIDLGPGYVFWFDLGPDGNNYAELAYSAGELQAFAEVDGNFTAISPPVSFDITAHRFWRLREQDGIVHYEVSGDGVAFDEIISSSSDVMGDWSFSSVEFGGYGDNQGEAQNHVSVAALTADATSAHCALDSLTDDFEDASQYPLWNWGWEDSEVWITEENGVMRFQATDLSIGESCAIGESRALDLTGSSVTLEMLTFNFEVGFWFGVSDATGDVQMQWDLDHDVLYLSATTQSGWVNPVTTEYDPVAMRFMRMREEGGMLYWEGSPDGTTFTTVGELEATVDFTTLRIVMGMYTSDTNTQSQLVEVDNLNIVR